MTFWNLASLLFLVFCGCTPKAAQPPLPQPKTEAEAHAMLKSTGEDWLYGSGVGVTAANVGGTILFPPYGIYVLGNSLLSLSGYEEIRITDALPEEERKSWDEIYTSVTSAPGKVAAAMAGSEFRSEETKQREAQRAHELLWKDY